MFKPNYHITDKILNHLTEIAIARDIIEKARLVPKWELALRRDALIHSTHSSTHIEGNRHPRRGLSAPVFKNKVTGSPAGMTTTC